MKTIIKLLFCLFFAIRANSQKVSRIEYFIDEDPGVGKGTALQIGKADTIRIGTNIKVPNLLPGIHTLYVRAGNDTSWGTSESFVFNVYDSAFVPSIAKAEYFIDKDPGVGKANKIVITPSSDTIIKNLSITIPTSLDTTKKHYLGIRVANSKGVWSLYERDTFTVKATALSILQSKGIQLTHASSLFPNPARDYLSITKFTSAKETATISIYDEAGKLEKMLFVVISDRIKVNVSDLSKGAHFLYISDNDKHESFKFLKE